MADGPASEQPGIRTFLIADVRGYTLFTQERGDEAAAKLAAKFAALAREVVEEHGGSVIELRGDEALAVFTSARQAILAATHAQDRFLEETLADPTLPLPVGIGLDVGEAVPVEGGYRGGALNLAARLCGQAGPGEILASQGVIHLARKVDGVRTQDRGELHLKNLTEPVHVYRLSSEEADPAVRFREFIPAPSKPVSAPIRLAREHRAVVALVALALVAAVTVPAGLALRSNPATTIEGDALARIDPLSGQVTGSVPLQSRPGHLAADDTSVWVTLPDAGSVDQIDPETMTVRDTIPVGAAPTGIAIGGGSIWVTNSGSGTVTRIDQVTNRVVDTIPVSGGPAGVAFGGESVWVANVYAGTVSRIDVSKGMVQASIAVGSHPVDIGLDDRFVWVANAGAGTVSQIDPSRDVEVQQVPVGSDPESIGVGDGGVWVADASAGTVSRLDPATGSVTRTVDVGATPTALSVTDDATWVAQGPKGSVARVGTASTEPTETPIGGQAISIVAGNGEMWATIGASTATHRGGTLTVWGARDFFDSLDPAVAYSPQTWAILAMTNDGLVGFRRTSGTAGSTLFADLATSIPRPTDGGKTYTLTLRGGIRYSTGDVVRPEDFRRAIQRVLAHPLLQGAPSGGIQYFSGIVGANRCHPGRGTCDLERGIETDDVTDTVTFHLAAPDPDFLYALALPFAFALPSATPPAIRPNATVPATGPYVPTIDPDGSGITLDRNPYFAPWSTDRPDGIPDRILWRLATNPTTAPTGHVLAGNGDLSFGPPDVSQLQTVTTDHAGQFYVVPRASTSYVSFDTTAAPFDDPRVRRAVNLAIDRNKLQKMFGPLTTVTCQILPPNFPGYQAYCPYTRDPGTTWTAPDMEAAKDLVRRSGTRDMAVTVWTSLDWFPRQAAYVRDLLIDLGYRATLKTVSHSEYFKALFAKPRTMQLGISFWSIDYPAESGFLGALATCGGPSNETGFCDPTIERQMTAATRLQITQPSVAHERWAKIERDVMNQAPWVPLVNTSWANLVSPRVGDYQVSPQWGPLIDQMWVQ